MKVVFPYDGYEHLGIGYCAAAALSAGHQVALCAIGIGDYIRGYRCLREGTIKRERDRILAEKPDIVAFSLVSPSAGSMIEIAKQVRNAGITTIAGGPHVTAELETTVRENAFNALIRGEADEVFAAALDMVISPHAAVPDWLSVRGHLASQDPLQPDVNKVPFPAKELFYRQSPYLAKDYLVLSSRGCPYACIFCMMSAKRKTYLLRTPDSLLEELSWAKKRFSPDTVYFIDDIFGLNVPWLREFLPRYRKEIALPFHAITHPAHVNEETAALMREAGCFALRIGVQTMTPRIRKRIGRTETDEQVHDAIDVVRKRGIRVEIDHMVDLPGETVDDARAALHFYASNRPDAIKVYWLMPLPGSRWFREAQTEGRLSKELADLMRKGRGFGSHSYLFKQKIIRMVHGSESRCCLPTSRICHRGCFAFCS